jgi:hypothetical protein
MAFTECAGLLLMGLFAIAQKKPYEVARRLINFSISK